MEKKSILSNPRRMQFSGGEEHITITDVALCTYPTHIVEIHADLRNGNDIMALLMEADAWRRLGAKELHLIMPYIPYARQDRVCNPGEALSVKVFADLINAQKFDTVEVWDPHSDVATALLNNVFVREQQELLCAYRPIMGIHQDTVLVCPDAGARKKAYKNLTTLGLRNAAFADKRRDTLTGRILGTELSSTPALWDQTQDHLIVDDIADGGMTFIELTKALRAAGVTGKISLYVTHGIFSKGLSVFDGLIDRIYTPNSWIEAQENSILTILKGPY
jgi:ribose-phosphate pyrophosphokinase